MRRRRGYSKGRRSYKSRSRRRGSAVRGLKIGYRM